MFTPFVNQSEIATYLIAHPPVPPMTRLISFALHALSLAQAVLGAPQLSPRAATGVDAWLATETTVALDGILANIGSSGAYAKSAKPGVVIASPSTSNPDCMYQSNCERRRGDLTDHL